MKRIGAAPAACLWLLLLLSALALFFRVAWDPRVADVAGSFDVERQFVPANFFFDWSLHHGDFPEWNPLVLSGMPHAADPQTWALYPPNALRAWVSGSPTPASTARGLAVLMALHVLAFGVGIFALARRHGLTQVASALATLAAVLSALFVRRVTEFHFAFTLAWLPWILLAIRALWNARNGSQRARAAGALGAVSGLCLLGGFVQIYLYMGVAAALYAAGLALGSESDAALPGRSALRSAAWAGVAAALALGIAASLLLPAFELLQVSARSSRSGFAAAGYGPEAWSLAYVWKSLCVYPGRIYEPETVRGAGVVVLVLALTGIATSLRRALPFALALYGLVDLMIGPPAPLSALVSTLAPLQLVSPTRAADVAILPFALLAGFGLDAFRRDSVRARASAAAVAAGVGVLALRTLVRGLEAGVWLEAPSRVVVAPALAVGVLVAASLWHRFAAPALACVLALAFVELQGWSIGYVADRVIEPGHDAERAARIGSDPPRFWSDNRRGSVDVYNTNLFRLEPAMNGYEPLQIEAVRRVLAGPIRGSVYLRAIRESEIPERNPRGHLFMKRSFWLADAAVFGPLPLRDELFAPTRFVFLPDGPVQGVPMVGFDQVPRLPYSQDVDTFELAIPPVQIAARDAIGRDVRRYELEPLELPPRHAVLEVAYDAPAGAELAPSFETPGSRRWLPGLHRRLAPGDAGAGWARIPLPDLSPLRIRLETLSAPGPAPRIRSLRLVSDLADEDPRIHVVSRSADEVTVDLVGLPAPRVLVFLDAYYPGWKARLDGRPVAIVRAQDAFKAVVVPAGDHRVVFRFASATLRAGMGISVVAWIAAAALVTGAPWLRARSASHRIRPTMTGGSVENGGSG